MSVTDSATSTLCFDDFSVLIVVDTDTTGSNCNASFLVFPDPSSDSIFVVSNSTGYNLNYSWDFGDGASSGELYPKHHYLTDGPYNFCLTINDSSGCQDVYCESVGTEGLNSKNGFYLVVLPAPPSGIDYHSIMYKGIKVYPNPSKNFLIIEHKYFRAEEIEIYDFVSNLCRKYPVKNPELSYIDIRDLSSGIYFIIIKGKENTLTRKIIKL